MSIDFSWSIDDWMAVIREFFNIVADFFAGIGIDIFKKEEEQTA